MLRPLNSWFVLGFALCLPLLSAHSEPPVRHHLFHPVPRDQLRDLSPDRPDVTESPVTVDAGHFQAEVSLFDWTRDRSSDAFTVLATNLKAGLTDRMDFQVVFDASSWERPGGSGGSGDVQLRLKRNLWGNDDGRSAFALFPYVTLPGDDGHGRTEGGLILPFSLDLTDRMTLGAMSQFDVVWDERTGGHRFESLHSAVLGFGLTERLGFYTELAAVTGFRPFSLSFSGGCTYRVTEDFVLDAGGLAGLTDAAEDVGLFLGFTRRF